MTNKAIFEVYAVKQREKNYSICDFDKNWYSGFGTSPVAKGHHVEIEWEQNGDFKNIKTIIPAEHKGVLLPSKDIKAAVSVKADSSAAASIGVQTLIVRQSCLKAAIESVNKILDVQTSFFEVKTSDAISKTYMQLLLSQAEEFEKWVMRE